MKQNLSHTKMNSTKHNIMNQATAVCIVTISLSFLGFSAAATASNSRSLAAPTLELFHELPSGPRVLGTCADSIFFIARTDDEVRQDVIYAASTSTPSTPTPILTAASAGLDVSDSITSDNLRGRISELQNGFCPLTVGPEYMFVLSSVVFLDDYHLYTTDGTPDGTVLIKDYWNDNCEGLSSNCGRTNLRDYLVHGRKLFYFIYENECQLWVADGTVDGTTLLSSDLCVAALAPMKDSSNVILVFANGNVYSTDGTIQNTHLLGGEADCRNDVQCKVTKFCMPSEDYLQHGSYFFGTHKNLWKTDGTADGTQLVKRIAQSDSFSGRAYISSFSKLNDSLMLFRAQDMDHGLEVWNTDGTAEGTTMVKDIAPMGSSNPSYF